MYAKAVDADTYFGLKAHLNRSHLQILNCQQLLMRWKNRQTTSREWCILYNVISRLMTRIQMNK